MHYIIEVKDDGTAELRGSMMTPDGVVMQMPQEELKDHLPDPTYKAYLLALSRFSSMESQTEWLEDSPNFRKLILELGCYGARIAVEGGSRWVTIYV